MGILKLLVVMVTYHLLSFFLTHFITVALASNVLFNIYMIHFVGLFSLYI